MTHREWGKQRRQDKDTNNIWQNWYIINERIELVEISLNLGHIDHHDYSCSTGKENFFTYANRRIYICTLGSVAMLVWITEKYDSTTYHYSLASPLFSPHTHTKYGLQC